MDERKYYELKEVDNGVYDVIVTTVRTYRYLLSADDKGGVPDFVYIPDENDALKCEELKRKFEPEGCEVTY